MYYEKTNRLGYLEFQEVFYDRLSRLITNSSHIENFEPFYEHYCFKSFEKYNNSKTEDYTINQIISLFEVMLDSLFKYQPDNFLSADSIDIS
jgi:hypothetical protein